MSDSIEELANSILTKIGAWALIVFIVAKIIEFVYKKCQEGWAFICKKSLEVWSLVSEKCLTGWNLACEECSYIWMWIRIHQMLTVWIAIVGGITLIGYVILKRFYPRVWNCVKLCLSIVFWTSIVGTVIIFIFRWYC